MAQFIEPLFSRLIDAGIYQDKRSISVAMGFSAAYYQNCKRNGVIPLETIKRLIEDLIKKGQVGYASALVDTYFESIKHFVSASDGIILPPTPTPTAVPAGPVKPKLLSDRVKWLVDNAFTDPRLRSTTRYMVSECIGKPDAEISDQHRKVIQSAFNRFWK